MSVSALLFELGSAAPVESALPLESTPSASLPPAPVDEKQHTRHQTSEPRQKNRLVYGYGYKAVSKSQMNTLFIPPSSKPFALI